MWQLDKWGGLVRPKSRTARRTIPLRPEVVEALAEWRDSQAVWADRLGDEWGNEHDLVFTTRSGGPVWSRNVSRAFTRVQQKARVPHGSLKTTGEDRIDQGRHDGRCFRQKRDHEAGRITGRALVASLPPAAIGNGGETRAIAPGRAMISVCF